MCETADKEKKIWTPALRMKIQHLKMVPGQKTSLGTQFIFNVEQQNMPDENLTEKIWWDLRHTFGANIGGEKINSSWNKLIPKKFILRLFYENINVTTFIFLI